ncbi:DUF262 domain-containing protein [Rhodobacter sp. Har01]|uniref:GmrSD restriction endonuclease domain-containing protein n=1 Tax=Rhodobacter sp. Har01 TaxID=2883999 RepID=UPI001D078E2B|nr:DUF262 domain-containing protein [Rhodobacter sp. Har01]MCB6178743.1 DUF262 domain-containing protein [Rhodobacter sp. Har01]
MSEELEFDDGDDEYIDNSNVNAFSPMRFNTMQRKVRDLLSDYVNKELDPRPSFQRGFVWDKGRASRLIESILLNVPLPLIYTAEEPDKTEVVIDGQQRLLSVFGFVQGKFPREQQIFRLTGLKLLKELNGLSFDKLEEGQKKAIQDYIFQIIKISNESHADVKFEIFERLNSGSVTLNAQELRNCVYRGNFNDVLRKLAQNPDFRTILGGSSTTSRMQDAELVLRFLAFYERTYLNYPGAMKSFLNDFMNDFRNISAEKADQFDQVFRQAASLSLSVFGSNAFRKFTLGRPGQTSGSWENQLNRPLFDIVMWGFTRFDKNQVINHIDEIRNSLIELMTTSTTFVDSITAAVGDKAKTQFRFELWHDTLKEIILSPKQGRTFNSKIRRSLFEMNPVCAICQQAIHTLDDAHVDHIKPYVAGGATDSSNAQLTHRYCNLQKASKQG